MSKPLRVLMLEDSAIDEDLVVRELRRAGFDPDCQRVETEATFLAGLKSEPELILVDFRLPHYDGLRALTAVRELGLDIPVIVVSGTLGEESVVATMKVGATDFLLKDRLARLGNAVERALEERIQRRERRRVEAALIEGDRRLDAALNAAHLGTFRWEMAHDLHIWSHWHEVMWGYAPGEFPGTHAGFAQRVHPGDLPGLNAELARCMAERSLFQFEFRVVWPDGSVRWVASQGSFGFDSDGKVECMTGVVIDTTARKLAEMMLAAREEQMRAIFDTEPECVKLLDAEGHLLEMNAAGLRMIEADSFQQVQNRSIYSMVDDADRPASRELSARVLRGETGILEIGIVGLKGRKRRLEVHAAPMRGSDGTITAILEVARDITERKEQERRIARLDRIRSIIGGVSSAILRLRDRDQLLKEVCSVAVEDGIISLAWVTMIDAHDQSSRIVAVSGTDPATFEPIRIALLATAAEDRPGFRAFRSRASVISNDLDTEASAPQLRDALRRSGCGSGAAFPLWVDGRVVAVLAMLARERGLFDAEEVALLEWMTGDLSFALEAIDTSARLEHVSFFDPITELANARLFQDRLNQFVMAARQDGSDVCVVVIDLEGFTRINDEFGRDTGDEVLRLVGKRLVEVLTEPYALGRIGADTFVAACPGAAGTIATSLRMQMLDALRQPLMIEGHELRLSAQAGIALFPADGADGSSVFKNAEAALKLAKSSGERFCYYSVELNARILQRRIVENQLRAALDEEQFLLHFQPRVDMISAELIGAEALLRWQHPQRGLLGATEFICAAEESGLMVEIGSWVLNATCRQLAAWRAANLPLVPISINLSSLQFNQVEFLQHVCQTLAAHAVEPGLLIMELTESAVMGYPKAVEQTLLALKNLGVGLSLDNFGTGQSSLAHLRQFPFDSVKIDRSFVASITSKPEDAAIATAVIAMAHSLGLKVVAEGVESQGQFNYLRLHACDQAQGDLVGPTVDAEDFEANLRNRRQMSLPATTNQRTLLLVDDEPGIRSALARMLRADGYRILSAASGQEALDLLAENRVQVIISDQRMPGMTGTAFLDIAKKLYPDTIRIILSGYTDLATVTDAVNRGAVYKFLTKPWEDEILREQVRDAFRCYRGELP